ncbi:MAG: Gfo/Idh/MocA family oxidoreductase [Clostridiales bacterium]|jgi:predicted dehydrogenase|nr:Gfo/Idh/MocA family oxidoreductase [Clostridiales bacterium]
MSKMHKIKVGVFGAYRGMTMINVMARHPEAELVAICDKYQPLLERCKKVAEETGSKITYYTNFEAFFHHDMDAVVLANYATEHAPYAIRLLNSGRHVVSEVLPVQTMAEAVQLVEAVEQSGKVYSYAENYCYFAATQEMKRLYASGEIGEFMHGEGEYVHNCEPIWHLITYGDKNHWRNRLYSTYYCTHSLGPIITITGERPVKVVGFETPNARYMAELGYGGGTSGMILAQMSNGATVKSLHGNLKREPSSIWYCIYGDKGMMESDRWHEGVNRIYVYKDGEGITDTEISYQPKPRISTKLSRTIQGHSGSDFYTMHYFLEKILGRPDGEEAIDVYQALDMALPGILAYRSICNGNIPIEVPDFRDKAVREKYRNDNWCTDPNVAGDNLAPRCSFGSPDIPDEVYERVRKRWKEETAE